MIKKIIKFSQDNCSPCRVVSPIISKLCADHNIELINYNCDSDPSIPALYGIMSVPVMIVITDKGEERYNGERNILTWADGFARIKSV